MRLAEGTRKVAAAFGGALFFAVSTFPLLGGAAKQAVRCRGREYTGTFDGCFNDYLPILELAAPLLALALLWPFLRFAFTLWAPEPRKRTQVWRLASASSMITWWPQMQIAGAIWAVWCLYRAALYPVDQITAPYQATWLAFALWTIVGLVVSWPKVED